MDASFEYSTDLMLLHVLFTRTLCHLFCAMQSKRVGRFHINVIVDAFSFFYFFFANIKQIKNAQTLEHLTNKEN